MLVENFSGHTPTLHIIREILVLQESMQWSSNAYIVGPATAAYFRHYWVAAFNSKAHEYLGLLASCSGPLIHMHISQYCSDSPLLRYSLENSRNKTSAGT